MNILIMSYIISCHSFVLQNPLLNSSTTSKKKRQTGRQMHMHTADRSRRRRGVDEDCLWERAREREGERKKWKKEPRWLLRSMHFKTDFVSKRSRRLTNFSVKQSLQIEFYGRLQHCCRSFVLQNASSSHISRFSLCWIFGARMDSFEKLAYLL